MRDFLLAFPALFSIVNPLGGLFIFLSATQRFHPTLRAALARWVAIYSFVIVTASLYVGAYVLTFFGVSVPVLRVAGGIAIALTAWGMLNAPDPEPGQDKSTAELPTASTASRMAFYPLTMPLTTGPGTISVAVSLGTNRPRNIGEGQFLWFLAQMTLATLLLCAIIYLLYRYADGISRKIGPTGTAVIMRLSAFLLLCIGIQIFWNGAAELLASVH
ncbi:MAG TPA: MarC family protein [Povalibacter sp.]|uniref:MarC family protein n=1 Tax=Povalibacter sp. TaxID=1962978 RepID=UPI002BC0C0A1|nr:MarC family protein [Povalibacter sp.]HMN45787.1 MarC family protein [Povalibacter sp.]